METKKSRRRIIDSSVVPKERRTGAKDTNHPTHLSCTSEENVQPLVVCAEFNENTTTNQFANQTDHASLSDEYSYESPVQSNDRDHALKLYAVTFEDRTIKGQHNDANNVDIISEVYSAKNEHSKANIDQSHQTHVNAKHRHSKAFHGVTDNCFDTVQHTNMLVDAKLDESEAKCDYAPHEVQENIHQESNNCVKHNCIDFNEYQKEDNPVEYTDSNTDHLFDDIGHQRNNTENTVVENKQISDDNTECSELSTSDKVSDKHDSGVRAIDETLTIRDKERTDELELDLISGNSLEIKRNFAIQNDDANIESHAKCMPMSCVKHEVLDSPLDLKMFTQTETNMKYFFGEEDSLSSITDTSDFSKRTVDSSETLICYTSGGLFGFNENDSASNQLDTTCSVTVELCDGGSLRTHEYEPESRLVRSKCIKGLNTIHTDTRSERGLTMPCTQQELFYEELNCEEKRKGTYVKKKFPDPCVVELKYSNKATLGLQNHNSDPFWKRYRESPAIEMLCVRLDELHDEDRSDSTEFNDECSQLMAGTDGIPRLLSVEEKWQIIFNEKTRAPIYAVTHYLQYLNQFVSGHTDTSRDGNDVIKKDGISPLSYLLRKLKLDLKMSYDSFIEEFLKPKNNGMNLLVKLLNSIQNTGSRQFGSASMTQLKNYKKTLTDEHDCLLCIKYSLRLKGALSTLLDDRYGLEAVCTSLVSTFTKSRGTAVEILTIAMAATDGFARVLDCFTYLQLKIGEPVRFKSLVNMMNMDSPQNIIFKVSSMKFVNTLLDASSNTNVRVFLQHELEQAGLDVTFMAEKLTGNGLEYDDLRHELANWQRKYVNVDHVMQKRATVLQTQEEMHNSQKLIADLQHQVQKLCTEKENLARTLKLVSIELKQKHADLRRRYDDGCDAFTQCSSRDVQDVALQCDLRARTVDKDTPLRTAAEYFRWNTTITGEKTNGAIFYPPTRKPEGDNADDDRDENQPEVVDEEGAVKVSQWLKTHCSSSTKSDDRFCDCDAEGASNDASSAFGFKRNSLTRRRARKTEFPGNWKLIPKSIERFPSRFPTQCCHVTKCDRCDIRDGPDNSGQRKPNLNEAEKVHFGVRLISNKDSSKRLETHSQSSDSAIGGSGDRLWNERRLPVLPVAASDEDVLQDLVQPDDSASGCTKINEPLPDYSFRTGSQADHNSFIAELSSVLREFEGHLLMYETPVSGLKNNSGHKSTPIETYVSLGNI